MLEKLQPLNGQLLVEHIDKSIEQKGGLFIVNNENARNRAHTAKVIKSHPSSTLKPGQIVFYTVHTGGTEVRDGNKVYKFMREVDLLACLSE